MSKALLFLSICLLACGVSTAQQVTASRSETVKVEPPGTIDGAKHPEQIPDLMAYRLFFVQVSLPAQPSADDSRRHEAKLGRLRLSAIDRLNLELAIAIFRDHYAAFLENYKTAPVDEAALSQRDAITQEALDRLRTSMSMAGFQELDKFIQLEKRHMKRVPMPKM